MKPYLFKIGNFELRIYSLMYIIAFLAGIFIANRDEVSRKRGMKDKKMIEDFAFWSMISGLIGARLYYVLLKFGEYVSRPLSIFKVWEGGLAIHGAIIGGLIGSYIYAKKNKVNIWVLTDAAVGPLFEMQTKFKELVPWGIVFPKDTPAGMEFPDYPLHPAMLYESALNLIGFLILWYYFRKKEYNPGVLSMIYLIMYAVIRVFVSTFRAEDLTVYGIRAPYLISIVMLIGAFIGIKYFSKKERSL